MTQQDEEAALEERLERRAKEQVRPKTTLDTYQKGIIRPFRWIARMPIDSDTLPEGRIAKFSQSMTLLIYFQALLVIASALTIAFGFNT